MNIFGFLCETLPSSEIWEQFKCACFFNGDFDSLRTGKWSNHDSDFLAGHKSLKAVQITR